MLKVFGQPAATDVARVLTCLFEKDLHFQIVRIDSFKGEHKAPEFLRVVCLFLHSALQNPCGQATFKDGDVTLVDSRDICRYISRKYEYKGNKALSGTGFLQRASIEQWLQAEAVNFEPPSSALVFQLTFAPALHMPPDEELIKQNEEKLSKVLDIYNSRLGESEYLTGDTFTLADLSHLPNSHYLAMSERGRKLFETRGNVARWSTAISARPSWKQVVEMQKERPGLL
ncbi:glutathione s-transferase [Musa troglodytarum]|uniref:glutathione transferase n=1 Tax=Musa troglodytarum TaxID=320322 RepID=A0A9E7FNF9_9LILI|nr:glutathione s-transferase [Musa troglodytarum]